MHGAGNDFVLLASLPSDLDLAILAQRLCDRRFSIGADGLIAADIRGEKVTMRMWNPDGSESEMCGNGLRCFGEFVRRNNLVSEDSFIVQTLAGSRKVTVESPGLVTCSMGEPTVLSEDFVLSGTPFRGSSISMGNPHLVIDGDPELVKVWGPKLENHPDFPQRTNVHFARATSSTEVRMATWERGAGLTLACGTGACAAVVALRKQLTLPVKVLVPGGQVWISQVGPELQLSGPVDLVFEGTISV